MSASVPPKPKLSERLKDLMVEYGQVGVWTYFALFAIVLLAFAGAIRFGFHTATATGAAGVWGAAYLATKLTQPLRILATIAVTPFVARLVRAKTQPDQSQ